MTIDRDALRRLCEAATPGPYVAEVDIFDGDVWEAIVSNAGTSILFTAGTDVPVHHGVLNGAWSAEDSRMRDEQCAKAKQSQAMRDAQFLAAARTAIPELLDECERLEAEGAAWSDLCNKQNALLEEKYRVSDSNVCGWCRMAAGDPEQLPADVKRYTLAEVREHTLTCANNPLVAEANKLRAALLEVCDLAEEANGDPSSCSYVVPLGERVAELRKLAGEP